MNLGELREELREGILHDFSDLVAGASDQLWSDRRLNRYINAAEQRFALQSLVIRDGSTPEVCLVPTQVGRRQYPLHPSIIAIVSAKCQGDVADLARAGHANFNTYFMPDTYFFDPSSLSNIKPGKIVAYDTDEFVIHEKGSTGRMTLRLYPEPAHGFNQTIQLRVIRKPICKMREDGDVPEIPEEHHLDMLSWAAYLALRIVDIEEGAPDRAKDFKAQFEEHVAEASKISMRKLFAEQQWGFGRNGFSWETN